MLERGGPLHGFQGGGVFRHGREAVGRVADQVRLQPAEFLLPGAEALTEGEQAEQLVGPFVLQHVDRVALGCDAVALAEDVVAGHIARLVEGAVVAGVEDDESGVGMDLLKVFERDVHVGLGDRIALGFGSEGFGREDAAVEMIFLAGFRCEFLGLLMAAAGFQTLVVAAQRTLEFHDIFLQAAGRVAAVDVLRLGGAVLAEHEHVGPGPLQLGEEIELHVRILPEIVEVVAGRLLEGRREIFPEQQRLLPPDGQAVGVVAVAREEEEVVEGIAFFLHLLVGGHHFLQIAAQNLLVVAGIVCRHEDAAGIPGRLHMLGTLFRQVVVEMPGIDRVAADEFEIQRRRVVVAVGGDRRFHAREGVLIHLEGRGHVLALADAHHGNVPDQDHALQRGFLAGKRRDAGLHLLGRGPVARKDDGVQPFRYQLVAIGVHFGAAGVIGGFVDENGEGPAGLGGFRGGAQRSCTQQDGGDGK